MRPHRLPNSNSGDSVSDVTEPTNKASDVTRTPQTDSCHSVLSSVSQIDLIDDDILDAAIDVVSRTFSDNAA